MPEQPISLNLAAIIYRLLTNPRGWEVEDLRRTLRIEKRTWRKYKQLLRERFPYVVKDRRVSVREIDDGGRRFLRLEEPEEARGKEFVPRVAAHHLVRELVGFLGDTSVAKALRDADREFRSRLPDRRYVRHVFRNLDRILHCVPDAPKDYSKQAATIELLLQALVYSRRVGVNYAAAAGETDYVLEPLTLAVYRGGLYLLARFVDRAKVYNMAVDRIRAITLLDEHYDYPTAKDYSPEKCLEDSFGIFVPPVRKKIDVELIFANERWLKLYVRERRWSANQRFRDLPDGRLNMTFRVNSLVEVRPWVLQFGQQVELVKPSRTILMAESSAREQP
ncbi:WYL domain-containing protein [bacterium]|nr:WYL domain-containing protein [bacterium]